MNLFIIFFMPVIYIGKYFGVEEVTSRVGIGLRSILDSELVLVGTCKNFKFVELTLFITIVH